MQCHVDDLRNTDNAWVEHIVVNCHGDSKEAFKNIRLRSSVGIASVQWTPIYANLPVIPGHEEFLELVCASANIFNAISCHLIQVTDFQNASYMDGVIPPAQQKQRPSSIAPMPSRASSASLSIPPTLDPHASVQLAEASAGDFRLRSDSNPMAIAEQQQTAMSPRDRSDTAPSHVRHPPRPKGHAPAPAPAPAATQARDAEPVSRSPPPKRHHHNKAQSPPPTLPPVDEPQEQEQQPQVFSMFS